MSERELQAVAADITGGTSSARGAQPFEQTCLQLVPAGFLPSVRSTEIRVQHILQPPQARARIAQRKWSTPGFPDFTCGRDGSRWRKSLDGMLLTRMSLAGDLAQAQRRMAAAKFEAKSCARDQGA